MSATLASSEYLLDDFCEDCLLPFGAINPLVEEAADGAEFLLLRFSYSKKLLYAFAILSDIFITLNPLKIHRSLRPVHRIVLLPRMIQVLNLMRHLLLLLTQTEWHQPLFVA